MLEMAQTVEGSKFEKGGNGPDKSELLVEEFPPLPLASSATDTQRIYWHPKNQGYLFFR